MSLSILDSGLGFGCEEARAGFAEYLDGRLTGREMQSIATHLDECGHCARVLARE